MDFKEQYGKNLKLLQSPYDSRDYRFGDAVPMATYKIPKEYFTPDAGFTYDQSNSSQCCASAYSYIRFLQESDKEQSELTTPFCPSFTYANRIDGEDFEGMYLRSCCKKGREGSVLWGEMKYPNTYIGSKKEFLSRKEELLEKANPFRISSFYTCRNRKEIQVAIMETKAVLIGIPVYECFYTPDENGIVHYVKGQENQGGHAIVIDGWCEIDGKFYWRIKNSWNTSWGNLGDGHAYLPSEYPFMDDVYVICDYETEMKFKEYKEKFYGNEE